MARLEQNWGLWDTDGSFVSTWHEALFVLLDPPPPTCWLHLNTTDGGVALWGCSGHQNKISRSQRIFKPRGGVVQFSVCRQGWAGEMLDPHLFASSYCFLWRLSSFFFQGSALKPGDACVWEKERGTKPVLCTIPSHPSKCATYSDCCLIGSEMLFSGLTAHKGALGGKRVHQVQYIHF